ncbi:hypothetical protein HELRODRAFT_82746 [Helobdella robusta]|uniref:SMP-30/Gluconolactonase/LRE-like region domain-containing protein n=1 Tax=Helobdella robusta TaxID=6412 RepID=T1G4W0_HELRO|nr:hypothetical protein HELRODRAFT_82746 [Helobdella robusta]ESO00601.1 hypothetical protein HELRODRAFT_82746 [Helobdella robusta]
MNFKRFGNKGNQLGEFMNVQGVCHKNGQVYITDSKNQCIQVLDVLLGKFVNKFNLSSLPLKLQPFLIGISTDLSGKIYVTDYENHCVLLFDADGSYLKKIGYNNLLGPKGLMIDSQRNLLVIDNRGCCVQTFTAALGELTFRFGIQGYRDEELCRPHFCALSNDENHVIITDFRSDKVKIFTREGKFVKCFGANGLRGPTGLAVHKKSGDIVVCDFGNSKIQVYKSNGSYMHTVDTSVSQLSGPQGVCFIDDDRILVADSGNHCLKVFNYKS